jgi:methyltransferase (TIGR00027 family)
MTVGPRSSLITMPTRPTLTVSDTAYSIAAIRAQEAALPPEQRLFEDPYARTFADAGAHAAEGTMRYLALPFFRDGIRLRTRFIDDFVRRGLSDGIDQLVLLGAGLDARGLRLAEIEGQRATVFEIDFGALLAHKRDLLAASGCDVPPHVKYVACDFAAPAFERGLAKSLQGAGFRAGVGALFVWEGVIGYVDDAMIDRSLALMARLGGRTTRLSFTFGRMTFDPESALTRTKRAGFTSCEELGLDDVWRRYLPGDPHPNAFVSRVAVATV